MSFSDNYYFFPKKENFNKFNKQPCIAKKLSNVL